MARLTTELNWDALTNEAVKHLQALIRCDTSNPPGNETAAISYIQQWLAAEEIDTRIIEPTPGRPSLWARLPGNGSKRPLLLSHADVVLGGVSMVNRIWCENVKMEQRL